MITTTQVKSMFQEALSSIDLIELEKKVVEAQKVWDTAAKNFTPILWALRIRRLSVLVHVKPTQGCHLIYDKDGFFFQQGETLTSYRDWSATEIVENLAYLPLLIEKAEKEIQTLNDLTKS